MIVPIHYYLKKGAAAGEAGNEKLLIGKIQDRVKRGKELDQEKIYSKIVEGMKIHPLILKEIVNKKLNRSIN